MYLHCRGAIRNGETLMNSVWKFFKIIAIRVGVRSVAALLICLLAFSQYAAGQTKTVTQMCADITWMLVRNSALSDFYQGNTKIAFSGTNKDLDRAMVDYENDCENRGGSAKCDDFQRISESIKSKYGRLPSGGYGMSVNPQTCKIQDISMRNIDIVVDEPTNPYEAAYFKSVYKGLERIRTACLRENGSGNYRDGGPPSDYAKRIASTTDANKKWYAGNQMKGLNASIEPLKDYLKNKCKYVDLEMSSNGITSSCGNLGESTIKVEAVGQSLTAASYVNLTGTSNSFVPSPGTVRDLETFLIRLADWGRGRVTSTTAPFQIGPGQTSHENPVKGSCNKCCDDEALIGSAYLFGGPDQSIIVGQTDVSLQCEKNDKCGSSSGDPHICTHDSLNYDFQGVGEFILAKTENFEVQARHQAISKFASVNTAAAVRINDDRIAVYGGDPARLIVNGSEMELDIGDSVTLPGGAELRRDKRSFRVSNDDYVFEAEVNTRRMVAIRVNVPVGSKSGGLLGDRNDDRKDDIRPSDDNPLIKPVEFKDLYKKFGDSWRVSSGTSLFNYPEGESAESMAILEFPIRRTMVSNFPADTRLRAEAICKKAGITDTLHLENCTYDIALTEDETYADDYYNLPPTEERLEIVGDKPKPVEAMTVDGVKIELLSEVVASFPVEIRISGPAPKYLLTFAKIGSDANSHAGNPYSSVILKGGNEVVTIHAPHNPGEYELRLIRRPGRGEILLRIPFRSTVPVAEVDAEETAKAGGLMKVRVIGDVSPNTRINIVPVGSRQNVLGPHAFVKGGLDEIVTILYLPKSPGKYEIRYMSRYSQNIYAKRGLTIIR